MTTRINTLFLSALLCFVFTLAVRGQTSVFTYQGQLIDNGAPANGLYDLRFELWQPKGSVGAITNTLTTVSNGLFTVALDFGWEPFTGVELWLEIGVATNGGGSFVTLSPRQLITSAPYAMRARTASVADLVSGDLSANQLTSGTVPSNRLGGTYSNELTLDNGFNEFTGTFRGDGSGLSGISVLAAADGSPTNAVYVDEDGNVGIGTSAPREKLEVEGGNIRIQGVDGYDEPGETASLYLGSIQSYIRSTRNANVNLGAFQAPDAVTIQRRTGNLGVGVTNPVERLEVTGRIVVGDSTNNVPASGTIRWTGKDLEVYMGVGWVSLTSAAYTASPPLGMALVPAGSFIMGDTFGDGTADELPLHSVYVSAFFIDQTETTKAQWDEVYNWAVTNGYSFVNAGSGKAAAHPVQSVNWYDCIKWANARSEMEGRTPCYTVGGVVVRTNGVVPDCDWQADGYRLPTEAEWEKAARGGKEVRRFTWGIDSISHDLANYRSTDNLFYDLSSDAGWHPDYYPSSPPPTSPVASFPANGYGLYDMAGNVLEYCWDNYSDGYYSASTTTDPRGPSVGSSTVSRGGAFYTSADACRVASRSVTSRNTAYDLQGFRLVTVHE